MVRLLSTSNKQGIETMEKTIEEIRKDLKDSGDVHLQAIARLDHDRLVKLAEWIRGLDKN